MAKVRKDAAEQVSDYVESLPGWSKNICGKLGEIILNAHPSIAEDWKWGPNYNSNGMICGFGAFQKHVKFTFFNGSAMKDEKKLFNHCMDNEFSRSIKYLDDSEIDEKTLAAYIQESVDLNSKGFKREIKDKNVEVPFDLHQALSENTKALEFFNNLRYGYKKEFIEFVSGAKQEKQEKSAFQK